MISMRNEQISTNVVKALDFLVHDRLGLMRIFRFHLGQFLHDVKASKVIPKGQEAFNKYKSLYLQRLQIP